MASSTALTVTSLGIKVSAVPTRVAVVLTAAVLSGARQLGSGQVDLCNAAAAHCTDVHLLEWRN